jgi:hypothetical protein
MRTLCYVLGTCPPLPTLPPNVIANCTFVGSSYEFCRIACKDGYVFNGTVQVYNTTCSRGTNYQWSVGINTLPACQSKYCHVNLFNMFR